MANNNQFNFSSTDFSGAEPLDDEAMAMFNAQNDFNTQQEDWSAFSGTDSNIYQSDADSMMTDLSHNFHPSNNHQPSMGGAYIMAPAMQQQMQHQQSVNAMYHPALGWYFPAHHHPEIGPYLPANGPGSFTASSATAPNTSRSISQIPFAPQIDTFGVQGQIPQASSRHGQLQQRQQQRQQNNGFLAPPPAIVSDTSADNLLADMYGAEPQSKTASDETSQGKKRGRPKKTTGSIVKDCTCNTQDTEEAKIPRPSNKFFLYKQDNYYRVLANFDGPDRNIKALSQLGKDWKQELEKADHGLPNVIQEYQRKADIAAEEHKLKYPNYTYKANKAKLKLAKRYGDENCTCGAFLRNESARARREGGAAASFRLNAELEGYGGDAEATPVASRPTKKAKVADVHYPAGNFGEPRRSGRATRASASQVNYNEQEDDDGDELFEEQPAETRLTRQRRPSPIKTTSPKASSPSKTTRSATQAQKAKTPSPRGKTKTPSPLKTYRPVNDDTNATLGVGPDVDNYDLDLLVGGFADQQDFDFADFTMGSIVDPMAYSDHDFGLGPPQGYDNGQQQQPRRSLRSSTESQRRARELELFGEVTENVDYEVRTTRALRSSGGSGKGRGSRGSGKGNGTPKAASRRSPRHRN